MSWNKIIECVPNFSEGRDLEKIDQIVAPFRIKAGVKLLDYSNGVGLLKGEFYGAFVLYTLLSIGIGLAATLAGGYVGKQI